MSSGVLHPVKGGRYFQHHRFAPGRALEPFVEHYWTVNWDLPAGQTHVQETIPYPCVHLAFEVDNSEIVCLLRGRFQRLLRGRGQVFAARFRAGGFYPFLQVPMHTLLDQRISVSRLFPDLDVSAFETHLFAQDDGQSMANTLEQLLYARLPRVSPRLQLVHDIYQYICANRDVHQVTQVAQHMQVSSRAIQRLFACYVGWTPKRVIQRVRLHDAMQRITTEPGRRFSDIALELGYADQAHFTRDFKAVVGVSPYAYSQNL